MNMQKIKKLSTTLLACALVIGSTVGASAAAPSKGSDDAVSATMTKALKLEPATVVENGDQMQKLRITRVDGANPEGVAISIVPLTAIIEATEVQHGDQATMKAIPLVPAKVVPMEKIIMD